MKFFLLMGLALWPGWIFAEGYEAMVTAPLTDVRRVPSMPGPQSDMLQETQALFGETVRVFESSGAWRRIEAIEQMEYRHQGKWEGYPGWVLQYNVTPQVITYPNAWVIQKWLPVSDQPSGFVSTFLPLGSHVKVLSKKSAWREIDLGNERHGWVPAAGLKEGADSVSLSAIRKSILQTAALFIGEPYVWGGLSAFDPTGRATLSGLDCSGLVHVSYRVNGITVPRDSHEQFMKAVPLKRADLEPADLIFSASIKDPKKITHVMIYAGADWVIEAPQTGTPVRKITLKEKWGVPLKNVESGDTVGERVIYFGRLVPQS